MTKPFWKPEPIAPEDDWIAPWLKWSGRVSTLGWIVYGVFALAFDDIAVISDAVQSWFVIAGSVLIVTGAEMNTLPTVVAVARKWGRNKARKLDTIAFIVSLIGSIAAGLIAFSIRQTRLGDTGWRLWMLNWGPLAVGIAIAADFYAAGIELGLLKADYEDEMETWRDEKSIYDADQKEVAAQDPTTWDAAKVEDFRRVLGRLNGKRATLNPEQLESELAEDHKRLPSGSTVKRWLKLAQVEVK